MKVDVITAATPTRVSDLLPRASESVRRQSMQPNHHLVGIDYRGVGGGATRNALIAGSTADWVAILDDDDELLVPHLEFLFQRAVEGDVDVVYSDPSPLGHVPKWVPRDFDRGFIYEHNFIPATALIRREAMLSVGGYPDVYAADWGLWLLMTEAGYTFDRVPVETWVYHRHDTNESNDRPTNARQECLDLVGR